MPEIGFEQLKKMVVASPTTTHRTQYPAPPRWRGEHCALCPSTDIALLELVGEDGEHIYLQAPICNPHLSALLVFEEEDEDEE